MSQWARSDQISSWSAAAARKVSPAHREDLFALVAQLVRELADGGGLADAVDADDEDDRRLRVEPQAGVADVQHVGEDGAQGDLGLVDGLDVLLGGRSGAGGP